VAAALTRPSQGIGTATRSLSEQATAVTPDRLGDSVGRLTAAELRDVDAALAVVLGI
jgi:mRNA-degrading endonuclease toxin of MazEF toxin-antitoxin module